MRSSNIVVLTAVALGYLAAGVFAQKLNPASNQKHLVIAADQAAKLQTALNEASSAGFHVVMGYGQLLLLNRTTKDAPQHTYRTLVAKFGDLEKLLNAGADAGFIVIPQTLTSYENEVRVTMGRLATDSPKRTYRVLEWDGSFEKNLSALGAKSIRPLGVIAPASGMAFKLGRPGRLNVALEIGAEEAGPGAPPVIDWLRQVSAVRTSALERELNQAASAGYRALGGSLMSVALQKVATPTTTYSYRVIGASRGNTLVAEIQEAGREGYRVLPTAIMANPGSRLETVVVMEHASTASQRDQYAFVTPSAEASTALFDLTEKGFMPAALVGRTYGESMSGESIILERALNE